jgi:hypothetical protein
MNKKSLTIASAIYLLQEGQMVRRPHWPLDTFVFRQVPSEINSDIVPKMQSLPDAVKLEFERRFKSPDFQIDRIFYANQLALVNSSNLIQSYSASIADAFAEDWEIYCPK